MRVLQRERQFGLYPRFTLWPLKGRRARSAGAVCSACYGVTVCSCEGVPKFATEQEGDVPAVKAAYVAAVAREMAVPHT